MPRCAGGCGEAQTGTVDKREIMEEKSKENLRENALTVDRIYDLRQKFIVIGLTGRTGSGCTQAAKLLCSKRFEDMRLAEPRANGCAVMEPDAVPAGRLCECVNEFLRKLIPTHSGVEPRWRLSNDDRKYKMVYKFIKAFWENKKPEFQLVKASDVILMLALQGQYKEFVESFVGIGGSSSKLDKADYERTAELAKAAKACLDKVLNEAPLDNEEKGATLRCFRDELPAFQKQVFDDVPRLKVTSAFQKWGNNIRKLGVAYDTTNGGKFDEKEETSMQGVHIDTLAKYMNAIVKLLRKERGKDKATFVVIDSLRNPYEVLYFRERYTAFYLASIHTSEPKRKRNLKAKGFAETDIVELDKVEYPSKRKEGYESYSQQDVERCVEMSDVHIAYDDNPEKEYDGWREQIARVVALMLHPGLVSPSPEERLMQVALTAKLNSGCVSRQVGAAVTDEYFSVKSIGWNTAPQGQTPCSLRSLDDLYKGTDREAFSRFEREDDEFWKEGVKSLCNQYEGCAERAMVQRGLTKVYCFKSLYQRVKKNKNQVYTRSLHAEENAFLQLAKYGSTGIMGGKLFTTASPCELCAKKAYQLGIKDIYYIDIYPGISENHILRCGENTPTLHLFRGVIGNAYLRLYSPMLPQKDEVEFVTGVPVKYGKPKEKTGDGNEDKKAQED